MRISDVSSDVCSSDLLRIRDESGGRASRRLILALQMIVWTIVGICFKGASGAAAICNFAPLKHGLGQKAVYQDLRLPDERLRFRPHGGRSGPAGKIGRASCRERVCQYV